jgi:hypothetical protein
MYLIIKSDIPELAQLLDPVEIPDPLKILYPQENTRTCKYRILQKQQSDDPEGLPDARDL